jgi:hypothetical protein
VPCVSKAAPLAPSLPGALSPPEAWLSEKTIFMDGKPYIYSLPLGTGASSTVDLYRMYPETHNAVVIKTAVHGQETDIDNERDILLHLEERAKAFLLKNQPATAELLGSLKQLRARHVPSVAPGLEQGRRLCLQPRCTELKLTNDNFKVVVNGLVTAIKIAACAGYIHRDVRTANVMVNEEGEVVLLDWAFAISFIVEPQPDDQADQGTVRTRYQGGVSCASDSILTQLANGDAENPEVDVGPADDAESVVKTLLRLCGVSRRKQDEKCETAATRARMWQRLWSAVLLGRPFWNAPMQAARLCKPTNLSTYDVLRDTLEKAVALELHVYDE